MKPINGWRNIDNSLSVRISKWGPLGYFLYKFKLIGTPTYNNIKFCQSSYIEWADVTCKIPASNDSVDVIYSCHMLEHLDREEAASFLQEAKRVLQSNGIMRIAVPDLRVQINEYLKSDDADSFIEATHMCVPRPKNLAQRLRIVFIGTRHHQWMYDKDSLCRLLIESGFKNPIVLNSGETTINNPGSLNLEERKDESIYVEVKKT